MVASYANIFAQNTIHQSFYDRLYTPPMQRKTRRKKERDLSLLFCCLAVPRGSCRCTIKNPRHTEASKKKFKRTDPICTTTAWVWKATMLLPCPLSGLRFFCRQSMSRSAPEYCETLQSQDHQSRRTHHFRSSSFSTAASASQDQGARSWQ